ncbi:sarcosine oxidase subunit gamma [Pseudorhodobacter ferrugineus]|uniref:sarcosine oxidase subunit gamma n=1 Tax=Pseudorhodobacter ferrugineus TaxID=77008 RepID=UPI0003B45A67|nr:sarcosine oxidase subunit gamma [Pseudorhodobacter ferrugineus]
MADLIAKTPLWGQGAVVSGGVTLAEVDLGQVTSVAPFVGQEKTLAAALKPLVFPAPNMVSAKGAARLVWTGRGQAFLIGAVPDGLDGLAALTDQSDGWAGVSLTGAGAVDVLARLIPLDLRDMAVGACARTSLGHMAVVLIRVKDGFELLVFRSMARTAWHELEVAMKMRAARLAC